MLHFQGTLTPSYRAKLLALVSGVVCQISFLAAVGVMAIGLHGEMVGLAPIQTVGFGAIWNGLLLLLFPSLHSLLLSSKGRQVVAALLPGETGRHLVTTTFVTIASLQLIALFLLWAHLGQAEWRPPETIRPFWEISYAASWILLAIAMVQAGLGIQMGLLGWTSVLKGKAPRYPSFPTGGLYTVCRHPVYFAMALVSCTGPIWNLDHAVIASVFTTYCIIGPIFKERRIEKHFGAEFAAYRQDIPFFPTPRSILRGLRLVASTTPSTRARP
jgi:protein-S-isoprenylcysteine O-methyltransferase Ste14